MSNTTQHTKLGPGMMKHLEQALVEGGVREPFAEGRDHLTVSGTFQSDKYPTAPKGKVPLSVRDPLAQDLLWEYALRHAAANKHGDPTFAGELRAALINAGYRGSGIQFTLVQDLVDALKELIQAAEWLYGAQVVRTDYETARDKAIAAIAMATGENQ